MKKLNIFLIALLTIACAAVFVACNDEDPTSTTLYKPTAASTSLVYTGETLNLTLVNFSESSMTIVGGNSGINAGDYTCTIALIDKGAYTWNDGTTDDVVIDWKISRAECNKPVAAIASYRHTGSLITLNLTLFDADKMTITGGNTATDVGNYECTISLKDKVNYAWRDGTDTDLVIPWTITADGKTLLRKPPLNNWHWHEEAANEYQPKEAIYPYLFDPETMGITDRTYTGPGIIVATVWIKDKENYAWEDETDDDITVQMVAHYCMPRGDYNFSQVTPSSGLPPEINAIYLAVQNKNFRVEGGAFTFQDMKVDYFLDQGNDVGWAIGDVLTINPDNKIDIWIRDPIEFDPVIELLFNNLYFINNEIHFVYEGYTFVFSL
jgi:hypothetical protein